MTAVTHSLFTILSWVCKTLHQDYLARSIAYRPAPPTSKYPLSLVGGPSLGGLNTLPSPSVSSGKNGAQLIDTRAFAAPRLSWISRGLVDTTAIIIPWTGGCLAPEQSIMARWRAAWDLPGSPRRLLTLGPARKWVIRIRPQMEKDAVWSWWDSSIWLGLLVLVWW